MRDEYMPDLANLQELDEKFLHMICECAARGIKTPEYSEIQEEIQLEQETKEDLQAYAVKKGFANFEELCEYRLKAVLDRNDSQQEL